MEQMISEEEIKELLEVKGEIRGVSIRNTAEFVLREEGKEGLDRLEKAVEDLGHPLVYENIQKMEFYPLGLWGIYMIVMKKIFNYSEDKIKELGAHNVKSSFIIRLFMKYFFSLDKMAKEGPKIWKKYNTAGDLKVADYSNEEKYVVLRIENYHFHPIHCQNLKGYLSAIIQMIVKDKTTCEETKCVYRGDPYHEFLIKW